MNNGPIQPTEATKLNRNKKSLGLAVIVGFLPSAIFLILWFVLARALQQTNTSALLFAALACSVVCGLASTVMLFRRKTWPSIARGILLFALNAAISWLLFIACIFSGWHGR